MRHALSSKIYPPSTSECPGKRAVKIFYYKCGAPQTTRIPRIYREGLEDAEIESNFEDSTDEDESRMFAPELMLRSFIAQATSNQSTLLQEYKRAIAADCGQKAFRTLLRVFVLLIQRYKGRVVLVVDDLHCIQLRISELLETLTEIASEGGGSNCSVLLGGDPASSVLSEALRNVPSVGSTSEYQECCTSLMVERGHTRKDEILSPVQGTNEWIWEHPRFTSWAEDPRGALAIVGKPGSGKSVLAKHIMARLQSRNDGKHEAPAGSQGGMLLSAWFYSERSGEQFVRHQTLLRSFLHEFLTRDAQLFDLYKPVYRAAPPSPVRTWTATEMEALIKALAESGRSFLMVIDAVDEATDDSILRLVENIAQIPDSQTKFIVLTRPVRLLDRKFWNARKITLQSENEKDIRKVVFQRCATLRHRMHDDDDDMDIDDDTAGHEADGDWCGMAPELGSGVASLETVELQQLCDTIIERADGVMLWVILVFDSLTRMVAREGFLRLSEIRERATQLPTGLDDFYTRFVDELQSRLDENGLLKVRRVLMWISAASEIRPFTLGDLYDALAIPYEEDLTQLRDLKSSPFSPLERNRIPASSWTGRRRILQNLCGPFIDIIRLSDSADEDRPSTASDSASTIVQLIHQTVKDFLTYSTNAGRLRFGAEEAASMVRTSAIRYVELMLPRASCAYAPVPFETKIGWEENMDAVLSYFDQLRLLPFCAVLAAREDAVLSEIQAEAKLAILHGFLVFPTPRIPSALWETQSDSFVSISMERFFRAAIQREMVGAIRAMLSLSSLISGWWHTDGHTVRFTALFAVFARIINSGGSPFVHEDGRPSEALTDTPITKAVSEIVKWDPDSANPDERDPYTRAARLDTQLDLNPFSLDGAITAATKLLCHVWPLAIIQSKPGSSATLPLETFIRETLRRSRTSWFLLNVALYYIALVKVHALDRMGAGEDISNLGILELDLDVIREPRRMFLAGLIVAAKCLQDRNFSARAWSKISGLPTPEVFAAENALLRGIRWNLHVTVERYEWWINILGSCSSGTWTEEMLSLSPSGIRT
ncbi:hypothetical protein B0T16DRAFT_136119 [Cercophora newfieldiana]|uniref:AAA+ ATPase domain-containing protein n=1 Tax=Cercophora newfieldiana TaxID=92897 RepID=A0AA39YBQ0_9PEZI|nr:hypothetical protein B0T16DRAFT_136119 [Cercophora newfieldiana]